jgi:hypothetical protein
MRIREPGAVLVNRFDHIMLVYDCGISILEPIPEGEVLLEYWK